jgi:hypothetical protein
MTAKTTAYKAMNNDMTCRGFQYEIGKTYTIPENDVSMCRSGFHSCENPFDVLNYYDRNSRFFEVILGGKIKKENDKTVSSEIYIQSEISFSKMFDYFFSKIKEICSNSTDANTSGDESHANTSGDESHANTSGDGSHANTSGYGSHANTSGYGSHANTSGYRSHANTSGDESHANTSGKNSIASAIGIKSKVKADSKNSWINLINWAWNKETCEWEIKEGFTKKPGQKIKDTVIKVGYWYWFENDTIMEQKTNY